MTIISAKLKEKSGAASVLVVLVMIVFITLGLLAMVVANSNYQLSQKTLAAEKDYYSLDSEAENIISQLDSSLITVQESAGTDEDEYFRQAIDVLIKWGKEHPEYAASYIVPALLSSIPQDNLNGYFEFTVGDEKSSLKVQLTPVLDPVDPSKRYDIQCWQKINQQFEYGDSDDIMLID